MRLRTGMAYKNKCVFYRFMCAQAAKAAKAAMPMVCVKISKFTTRTGDTPDTSLNCVEPTGARKREIEHNSIGKYVDYIVLNTG